MLTASDKIIIHTTKVRKTALSISGKAVCIVEWEKQRSLRVLNILTNPQESGGLLIYQGLTLSSESIPCRLSPPLLSASTSNPSQSPLGLLCIQTPNISHYSAAPRAPTHLFELQPTSHPTLLETHGHFSALLLHLGWYRVQCSLCGYYEDCFQSTHPP